MSSSKILLFLCVSFVAGVFLESITKIPISFVWGFLFLGVIIILFGIISRYKSVFYICGFCVLFLLLGILRVQISEFDIVNNKLSKLNGRGEVVLKGVIFNEPDVRENSQKLKVKVGDSIILVTTGRYPKYEYLDKVELIGKLKEPEVFEDFNYKNYLLKDHIYSVMSFPKVEVLGKANGGLFSAIYGRILQFKQKMRQSIENNFLPPQSSLTRGIILGDKSAVSQELKDKFRITGLSHVIAVSGMHVAVLSSIIMSLLLLVGLWRRQAFYGAVIFISVYIILIGLPSSAIRAGIMGIIYLAGQALGRQTISSRIIVLAGALMLVFNPLLLFYDVGFQLSFLAVFGLIYLEPLVRSFIKILANRLFKIKIGGKYENTLMLFTVTISAQMFTLPIIIYNFGTISLISPITNLLIVPILYYVIFFGFLASLAGIIWGPLGRLLSLVCYFLMNYFLWIVELFNKPWAYKIISDVSWLWIFVFYAMIFCAVWLLNKKYGRVLF